MKLEQIADEKIALGVVWVSSENTTKKLTDARQRSWRRVAEKHHRRIEYLNADKKVCSGYSSEVYALGEPFALYVRNVFGDGIYYTNDSDDENYLLAIYNGEVIEGTDIFLDGAFFECYREYILSSDYASLSWNCLTIAHIEEVLETNHNYKKSVSKKKVTYLSMMLGIGVLFLSLFGVVLKVFIGT
ncbi:hypothetical protein [[Enterobacter] lignolyticus]|uniref:Pilus assembly protein n=1 Tax=Enterobacter lignolyticus (strain SCF1) TaxID=701347 RepID=E3G6F7_ENTLS|nr:hypothetical protein [[Enterobacter] lignolyticus]ADO47280.1 hypothetical protein Entcl_1008 [[Enterobacter] lignolyticus SCF1]